MSDRSFWMFWLGALFMGVALTPALVEGKRPGHPPSPISCNPYKLPTNIVGGLPANEIVRRCGAPHTVNQYPDGTVEWVYGADTFMWLRDGKLSAIKAPRS